ncbi:plasmid maintenance protein [Borreliella burgdorferi]|uniref:plasmid maintenance protein n=1 Tax=Borreliella burgdorferi TaxID=139 RepID=UPI001E538591|nr:plasmid maintenance protein [Borreliella burgdorferi]
MILQNRSNTRIVNNTKIVKNQKKYIFLNTYLEILQKNIEKNDSKLKEISNHRLSSHITKKEIEYQRLLKISWFLKAKYDEYIKSKNLKTYQLKDIIAGVNSMLVKHNNKPVTKRTIQKDIKKLIKMNLVVSFSKSLGKDNGGFSFYKINTNIWQNRIAIIRNFVENEIKEYVQDKTVVSIFKKEIDNFTFSRSNSPLSNSTLIYQYIKDNHKIRNSIENFSIKKEQKSTLNTAEKDKKVDQKKYIFLNTHLEILQKNIEKNDSKLKEISNHRLSSHITKKEIEYQRLLKISWFLKAKYDEYIKSKNLKTYQLKDIIAGVNSMLVKHNNKPVTKRTIQKDIKKLIKMNLVVSFSKSLGKDNGGFSFYKINTNIWQNRIAIIRNFVENEIKEYVQDKTVVSIFKKEIDNFTFSRSNSPLSNSTLIYQYIKDNHKIRNSIENFSIEKEQKSTLNTAEKDKKVDQKKEKFRLSYKKSFEEYQKIKLIKEYEISSDYLIELEKHSNNLTTYKNVLINLEFYVKYLIKQYDMKDILKFYINKFKSKYKNKIWFMSPNFNGSDFLDLIGEFKDKYESVYKKNLDKGFASKSNLKIDKPYVMFQEQRGYFENGIFHKVEADISAEYVMKEFFD